MLQVKLSTLSIFSHDGCLFSSLGDLLICGCVDFDSNRVVEHGILDTFLGYLDCSNHMLMQKFPIGFLV